MSGPMRVRLDDGRRLHLQHGPMDLIVEVRGPDAAVAEAEERAWIRFGTILDELAPQLPVLRAPVGPATTVEGTVARRMVAAAQAPTDVFVTPMVAVAGSVAQEICETLTAVAGLRRAYVNNGGDIAFHLAEGEVLAIGLVGALDGTAPDATTTVTASSGIRGVATSGRGGRSFSLGIADAVTVLATTAARADVVATLVANAVDLPGHPAVERRPAVDLDPDSDLGDRPVTVGLGALAPADVDRALARGCAEADRLLARMGDVRGVILNLAGQRRIRGRPSPTSWSAPAPREEVVGVRR